MHSDAQMIMEDMKRAISELEQESALPTVGVELVDNELATLYMNSKKSEVSLLAAHRVQRLSPSKYIYLKCKCRSTRSNWVICFLCAGWFQGLSSIAAASCVCSQKDPGSSDGVCSSLQHRWRYSLSQTAPPAGEFHYWIEFSEIDSRQH